MAVMNRTVMSPATTETSNTPRRRPFHLEEQDGQKDAGHGQADGALEQVADQDGQYAKGDQTDQ